MYICSFTYPIQMKKYFLIILTSVFFTSCIPSKNVIYFQGDTADNEIINRINNTPYKLQIDDILNVQISSTNSELTEIFQRGQGGGNMGAIANGVAVNASAVSDTLVVGNLPQGNYRVSITDSSVEGCQLIIRSVLVNGPGAAVQEIGVNDVSCPSCGDGEICLTVSAVSPVFEWSIGGASACLEDLPGSLYKSG